MSETKALIKVMILYNKRCDKELMQQVLSNEAATFEFCFVCSSGEYEKELNLFAPDIILSDIYLSKFSAIEALQLLNQHNFDIPFIILTAAASEELAISLTRHGADDYIVKENIQRLPIAIETALKQKRTRTLTNHYRYALDQAAIICIVSKDGIITYVNDNCCKISGYTTKELIGSSHHTFFSGAHSTNYFADLCVFTQKGNTWEGEFFNQSKNGEKYWLKTIFVPVMNEQNTPCEYFAISNDITAWKKIELQLQKQKQDEQVKLIDTALEAQERERNLIGQELHDNVNQILVGTKLLLSAMIKKSAPANKTLSTCYDNIYNAIQENRKIAHALVTPDFNSETFLEQLKLLYESMLSVNGHNIHIDMHNFNEASLSKQQKLAVYRISQEQCTNIVKYAYANNVFITLQTSDDIFKLIIADDGKGTIINGKTKGVGLKNIDGRVGMLNGNAYIISAPGLGFTLEVEIPLNSRLSQYPVLNKYEEED